MTFNQFTVDNHAVRDLNEVLFQAIFKYGDLFNTCSSRTGVVNGKIINWVRDINDQGKAGRGCKPVYENVTINGGEAKWELGDWSIPLQFCYKELENTIAEYCLKTGTERENIQGTEFWDKIFLPLLKNAIEEMYWRMVWFGDKTAAHVSEGGVITDTAKLDRFTMCDGFWKRLSTQLKAGQRTKIDANTKADYKAQVAAMRAPGAAIGLIENVLADANSLIENGILMVTKSVYQALVKDYRREFKATIPFMQVAEGIELPTYDGTPIKVVNEWDNLIHKYQDSGTKWDAPHRVVFADPEILLVGTSDKDVFADFSTGFDEKDRMNYTYAASNIGTAIIESDLVQVAW